MPWEILNVEDEWCHLSDGEQVKKLRVAEADSVMEFLSWSAFLDSYDFQAPEMWFSPVILQSSKGSIS